MTEAKERKTSLSGVICHAVDGMTIEKVMEKFNLEKIDILKIDIEGAEREVFRDTSAWIERVDAIIAELHDHMKPGCNPSFCCGTNGFDNEWREGRRVYLSRGNSLTRRLN